jgi:hypothetical protein
VTGGHDGDGGGQATDDAAAGGAFEQLAVGLGDAGDALGLGCGGVVPACRGDGGAPGGDGLGGQGRGLPLLLVFGEDLEAVELEGERLGDGQVHAAGDGEVGAE